MDEIDRQLANVMLDSLTLNWQDNGNICADAVRDSCLQALTEILDISVEEIIEMIDQRIEKLNQ